MMDKVLIDAENDLGLAGGRLEHLAFGVISREGLLDQCWNAGLEERLGGSRMGIGGCQHMGAIDLARADGFPRRTENPRYTPFRGKRIGGTIASINHAVEFDIRNVTENLRMNLGNRPGPDKHNSPHSLRTK